MIDFLLANTDKLWYIEAAIAVAGLAIMAASFIVIKKDI
jgi:hypothetical protein